MIHGVSANKPSFHPVEFSTGLNVVLAERTDTSTQQDTRNGLGKSTLIDIIDYCLGSKGARLRIDPLEGWEFTLDITLEGNRVKVTRSIDSRNRIVIEGPTEGWSEQPDEDQQSGERVLNLERWKKFLGGATFGLASSYDAYKYKPSYRSLISYFIRTGMDAYSDSFKHFRSQKTWDSQLHVAYLLGLNWELASKWQDLKDQEDALNALNKAIKTGAIEDTLGTLGELEAERVRLGAQIERELESLSNFRVHPQYKDIQEKANQLTSNIHELVNQNVTDRRRLTRYEISVSEEQPPSDTEIERLYEETGLVFSESVLRTLADAKEFHRKIVENRKSFLETEISRLKDQIQQRDQRIEALTEQRAELMTILNTHGALEEMTALQERHVKTKQELERVISRISNIKDIASREREISRKKSELRTVAEQDHEQRREIWTSAVRIFNDNIQYLYSSPGRLVINISDTGYKYNIEVERSGSEGIGKMKVFSFDLMLLQFLKERQNKIDFLVHDSILFDGVDSRQRALALQRAAEIADEYGVQYICALNSDMVPTEDFNEDFDFDRYVKLVLTDREPSGSLLGIQFER